MRCDGGCGVTPPQRICKATLIPAKVEEGGCCLANKCYVPIARVFLKSVF